MADSDVPGASVAALLSTLATAAAVGGRQASGDQASGVDDWMEI